MEMSEYGSHHPQNICSVLQGEEFSLSISLGLLGDTCPPSLAVSSSSLLQGMLEKELDFSLPHLVEMAV